MILGGEVDLADFFLDLEEDLLDELLEVDLGGLGGSVISVTESGLVPSLAVALLDLRTPVVDDQCC